VIVAFPLASTEAMVKWLSSKYLPLRSPVIKPNYDVTAVTAWFVQAPTVSGSIANSARTVVRIAPAVISACDHFEASFQPRRIGAAAAKMPTTIMTAVSSMSVRPLLCLFFPVFKLRQSIQQALIYACAIWARLHKW